MELAQRMFEAYNAAGPNPNKTWDGKDVPAWSEVGPQVTAKWRAAAAAGNTGGNMLTDTLEALLKEPTLGNQTEPLRQALSYAHLQVAVVEQQTAALAAVALNHGEVCRELTASDGRCEVLSTALAKSEDDLMLLKQSHIALQNKWEETDADFTKLDDAVDRDILLSQFAVACHSNSVAHGWWDEGQVGKRTFGDVVSLIHSEVSEALEAFREPGPLKDRLFHYHGSIAGTSHDIAGNPYKPDGVLAEFADVVIRILDYTESIKATGQFVEALKQKHAYNVTRPFRHGGKLL